MCPAGYVMPESPVLFSSVVPACGSCLPLQSRSRGVKESRSRRPRADRDRRARVAGRKVAEGSPTSRLLKVSTAKSREQSENVYENKGRGQKVKRSSAVSGIDPPLTRLATLATLSPGKRAADEVWSETRSNARECKNRENKASMSMKTKDKYKKSLSRTVPDQTPTARPRQRKE